MEQLSFIEIIERITAKLTNSDDELITNIYNQIFDTPVIYVGDDMWEEEVDEREEYIEENYDEDDEPIRKKDRSDYFDSEDEEY